MSSVYFIQEIPDGPIKIGWTDRPISIRLSGIQHGNCRELGIIACIDGASKQDEAAWHERFASLRIRGEWFRPDLMLLAAIKKAAGISHFEPILALQRKRKHLTDNAVPASSWEDQTKRKVSA